MRTFWLMMFLVVVSSNAMAAQKYTSYECENESDARTCSNTCKKLPTKAEFIVSASTGTVFQKTYSDRKLLLDTRELKNCRVADAGNWICGSGKTRDIADNISFDEQSFSDGTFVIISETHYSKSSGWKDPQPWYFCAKNK